MTILIAYAPRPEGEAALEKGIESAVRRNEYGTDSFSAILLAYPGERSASIATSIGIPMPPPPNANIGYTAYIRVAIDSVLIAGLIGWVATILASILPARRASRLSVVDALRHGL